MAQDAQNVDCALPGAKPVADSTCGVSLRAVERKDGPAVHALLTGAIPDVLPDLDLWLARWEWQCWRNPYRRERPAGWVFADGDRILGHLGAVYLPMRLGDQRLTGVVGADYAVAEEFLAQGGMFAGLELAQKLFADCGDCVVMATTANEKTGAVFGRFGGRPVEWTREFWRAPTTLGQQVRSCRGGNSRVIRRIMTSRMGQWLTQVMTVGHRLTSQMPAVPIPRGCRLEMTVPQLAQDLGQLWRQVVALSAADAVSRGVDRPVGLGVDRSQDYLDWRYGQHPEREHVRMLVVRDADDAPLGAAVVFRERRNDRHVMYVEDMIVLPHRRDVLRTLLCAALQLACRHGAEYLVTAPGGRTIREVFWELGFEGRARNAPAAVINMSPFIAPAAIEFSDDYLEFWHGMMF